MHRNKMVQGLTVWVYCVINTSTSSVECYILRSYNKYEISR